MDLSPGEALFESRLSTLLAQASAPLHIVHHRPPVPLGGSAPPAEQPEAPAPDGPPTWAAPGAAPADASADGPARASEDDPTDAGATASAPSPGDSTPTLDPSLTRLRDVGRERSAADAALMEAIIEVLAAVRRRLLDEKGLVGVELGRGQERSLDAEVRRAAVAEVEVMLGFGVTESQALVGLCSAAGDLRAVVLDALHRGEVTWPMVRVFWESSSRLADSQRLLVAMALFGRDLGLACEERLGCDGDLLARPWGDGSYRKACEREVRACEGTDVAGERERRRRAYARRRASLRVHDDGTATLSVTGPTVTLTAVHQRIDRIARVLRGAGDERNLDNLRCDTIDSLLLYGTIQLPGQDKGTARSGDASVEDAVDDDHDDHDERDDHDDHDVDAELVSPEALEEIARVVNAQPLAQVQVVVPHAVLGNALPICASCAGTITPGTPPGPRPPAAESPPPTAGETDTRSRRRTPATPATGPGLFDHAPTAAPPGRGLVAEVLGPVSHFITPGHARELVLLPGTTLHRLVVDPLDGRLVERSIATYRPDTDMRRQVVAADVYSRAPGARTAASACELDHVVPYGWAGGQTSEANLALLGKAPHRLKTLKVWRVAMGERRDLTFTTLLGDLVKTRSHDYRQYAHVRDAEDLEDRRDLAGRAVYAALAARPEHRYRRRSPAWLSLTHTDDQGATRPGPPPRPETLDEVLGRGHEGDDQG